MDFQLLCGHVLLKLQELPVSSVHCVVTSPPYWGLRCYRTQPQVWGGQPDCSHDWTDEMPRAANEFRNGLGGEFIGRQDKLAINEAVNSSTSGSFCRKCGAWRGELGSEPDPALYIEHLVMVFREVRRVLRPDGTLWLNIGSTYTGSRCPNFKPKDLVPIPWLLGLALQADGWWLRSDIVWQKANSMPEPVKDRPTQSHEYVLLLTPSRRYFYDGGAVREPIKQVSIKRTRYAFNSAKQPRDYPSGSGQRADPPEMADLAGRNLRDVWKLSTRGSGFAHYASFPPELPTTCIKAGTSEAGCCPECLAPIRRLTERRTVEPVAGAVVGTTVTVGWEPTCHCNAGPPIPCTVLDPFSGTGTTGEVALRLGRNYIGIELQEKYLDFSRKRLQNVAPLFSARSIIG